MTSEFQNTIDYKLGEVIANLRYVRTGLEEASEYLESIRESHKSEWISIDKEQPPIRDRYYLFGGYDSGGEWVVDKYLVTIDGLINGWSIETAKNLGNFYWMPLPQPPKG